MSKQFESGSEKTAKGSVCVRLCECVRTCIRMYACVIEAAKQQYEKDKVRQEPITLEEKRNEGSRRCYKTKLHSRGMPE